MDMDPLEAAVSEAPPAQAEGHQWVEASGAVAAEAPGVSVAEKEEGC